MINFGVIGYGYCGTNLVRNFEELAAARLLAVVDPDPCRLELARRRYRGVNTKACLREVLEDRELDAVAIATTGEHAFRAAYGGVAQAQHASIQKRA